MSGVKYKQMSESIWIWLSMAVVGGYLDAYTYIMRGNVFANTQTGNFVLFGMSIANRNWFNAMCYLLPIIAFGCGIMLSEVVKKGFNESQMMHWRQIVILIEIIIIFCVAFVPIGSLNMSVNISVSFVCGMQLQCFRRLRGNDVATTMCTGNFRSGMEFLFQYFSTGNKSMLRKSMKYYLVLTFFFCGAILGSLLSNILAERSPLVCCGILVVVLISMFRENKISVFREDKISMFREHMILMFREHN